MGGVCSTCGGEKKCRQILVGKSEGKRPLGTPKIRWEVNIKMVIQ
jgi:hypothetical protein